MSKSEQHEVTKRETSGTEWDEISAILVLLMMVIVER